jgi:hypothetical protein
MLGVNGVRMVCCIAKPPECPHSLSPQKDKYTLHAPLFSILLIQSCNPIDN